MSYQIGDLVRLVRPLGADDVGVVCIDIDSSTVWKVTGFDEDGWLKLVLARDSGIRILTSPEKLDNNVIDLLGSLA